MRQSPREQWCLLVAWCLGPNHLFWATLKDMGDQSAMKHACKLLAANRLRQKDRKFEASLSYIARSLFNNSNNNSIRETKFLGAENKRWWGKTFLTVLDVCYL